MIDAPYTLTLDPAPRTPSAPSRRACEAACLLGFSLDDHAPDPVLDSPLDLHLPPASITLLTGPSASGKSTLLACAERAAHARSWLVIRPERIRLRPAPLVDLFEGPVEFAMRALSRAGLAEARCFVRRPAELSAGQQARLRLALALQRARARPDPSRPALLVLDEFASLLDPASALSLARLLRAAVTAEPDLRALVACSSPALAGALRPDVHLERTPAARWRRTPRAAPDSLEGRFEIRPASPRDLRALDRLHYRAAPPARRALSLAMVDTLENEIVASLVVVMPTLNASWRALAWPTRFDLPDKRAAARRLNDELRRIARVVVDPRWRSLSLATRLVRHYLASPLTPCTEAVAAMGRCAPFFRSAGMTEYPLAPSARDARLLDALDHASVEPWRLASPRAAWARAVRSASHAFLERETRLWARASAATATRADHPDPFHLFRIACRSLAAPPVAYAHTHTS